MHRYSLRHVEHHRATAQLFRETTAKAPRPSHMALCRIASRLFVRTPGPDSDRLVQTVRDEPSGRIVERSNLHKERAAAYIHRGPCTKPHEIAARTHFFDEGSFAYYLPDKTLDVSSPLRQGKLERVHNHGGQCAHGDAFLSRCAYLGSTTPIGSNYFKIKIKKMQLLSTAIVAHLSSENLLSGTAGRT